MGAACEAVVLATTAMAWATCWAVWWLNAATVEPAPLKVRNRLRHCARRVGIELAKKYAYVEQLVLNGYAQGRRQRRKASAVASSAVRLWLKTACWRVMVDGTTAGVAQFTTCRSQGIHRAWHSSSAREWRCRNMIVVDGDPIFCTATAAARCQDAFSCERCRHRSADRAAWPLTYGPAKRCATGPQPAFQRNAV